MTKEFEITSSKGNVFPVCITRQAWACSCNLGDCVLWPVPWKMLLSEKNCQKRIAHPFPIPQQFRSCFVLVFFKMTDEKTCN